MANFAPITSRMLKNSVSAAMLLSGLLITGCSSGTSNSTDDTPTLDPALELTSFAVSYEIADDSVYFTAYVEGDAGSVVPTPAGSVDGAPVLGYVFPTSLLPEQVGFKNITGTVALAATSHPDFDDTPLWDEDGNEAYDDDGVIYHAHWVVLESFAGAPAGLSVAQSADPANLPPTAPMPMYLDSPGFTVVERDSSLTIVVPADRLQRDVSFSVGALVADMRVDASGTLPRLLVDEVLSAIDGGAANQQISNRDTALADAWPAPADDPDSWQITNVHAEYQAANDTHIVSLDVAGVAATAIPTPIGAVNGAPVYGYAFLTELAPSTVGFKNIDDRGTLALAVTSHPDFDDTPLWDENFDGDFANDGARYHVHWAVLVEDAASSGGLSVPSQSDATQLPPTAPMPMYLDSPGFHAFASGNRLTVMVPGWHIHTTDALTVDAVAAVLRVDASGPGPVLRLEEVRSSGSNQPKIDH